MAATVSREDDLKTVVRPDKQGAAPAAEGDPLLLVRRWLPAGVSGEAGVAETTGAPAP